ncbi:MAG: methyltransferase domain-containing protein [Oscillospiraceae bacterium]|nr:methyltransferase domain-containing protein [Oscillospiraceae bacterium]
MNTVTHSAENAEKAKRKQDMLCELLCSGLATLPRQSAVFEIGSGDGVTASYLKELGFDVTASDVADTFIENIRMKQIKVIHFDVLKDQYPEKYRGIVCWRVFVHFTTEDAKTVLFKTYKALEKGGRFIFNALNRKGHASDAEWLDFQGVYNMGAERYFHYFDEAEMREMIALAGYQIINFRHEGGTEGDKWLTFVLEK